MSTALEHPATVEISGAELRPGDVWERGSVRPTVLRIDDNPALRWMLGPGSRFVFLDDRRAPTVVTARQKLTVQLPRPEAA